MALFASWLQATSLYGHSTLRDAPSDRLVAMLSIRYQELPREARQEEEPYESICSILLERRQTRFLLDALAHSSDVSARYYLVSRVLYQIEDPAIVEAFKKRLSEEEDDVDYFVANYLAKLGDARALEILNRHYFHYPVSSLQWSDTAALFGKFGYRPAIPNLVQSLHAASLNLAGAALDSLQALYPDAPKHFDNLDEARDYFQRRMSEGRDRDLQATGRELSPPAAR